VKKQTQNKTARTAPAKPLADKRKTEAAPSLLNRLESFLERNEKIIFYATLLLSLVFSVLLFDVKMSEGNDDSMYIEVAHAFAKDFSKNESVNAPFYSILLSFFIRLFGVNVIMLKSTSIIFQLLQLVFLYLALNNRVKKVILFPILIFTAINSQMLYFASETYTETFYLFLTSLMVFAFFKATSDALKIKWIYWALLGLTLLLMSLTKNVAIALIGVIVVYHLLNREFKFAALSVAFFAVFRGAYEIFNKVYWGVNQFAAQGDRIWWKDPYDQAKGNEDFSGLVTRFFGNLDLYISKRLFQILGFKDADSTVVNSAVVFFIFLLLLNSLFWMWRNKDKVQWFIFLTNTSLMFISFIVLATRWDQLRIVLVFVPFLLLNLFYGFYHLFKNYSLGNLSYLLITLLVVFSSLLSSTKKAAGNFPVLKKNFGGDIYYGYTNDWQNFLKMSAYCADSLPANSYVGSRKAPMSFIYGKGKKFYPIYTVTTTDADSVLALFKKEKVTHVIIASLRRNPKKIDGYLINTVHRMVGPLAEKYPEKFRLVKQIGESEPAYLYEIQY